MSPLRLNGSTSGYSQLDAPAIAGDQTFTLPGTGGTLDRLNRAGNILQVVNYQTGATATGTTRIPVDTTIPQNTEGNEYMTLTITPTNASNKLFITVVSILNNSAINYITAALFQDSTANALAAAWQYQGVASTGTIVSFNHYMTAGTTSSTTFKVRAGGDAVGTTYLNGFLGGVLPSSITIMEIAA